MKGGIHALLLVDWLELNSFVCVLSPARRAFAVEVFLDMMPTEATDLSGDSTSVTSGRSVRRRLNLITTGAGPEVQVGYVHLLETEGAFLVLLVSIEREK
jgi:hypothetical protein